MGLADDMKAITDAAQALVAISKHIAKENNHVYMIEANKQVIDFSKLEEV